VLKRTTWIAAGASSTGGRTALVVSSMVRDETTGKE
jgi:hypothetical protein